MTTNGSKAESALRYVPLLLALAGWAYNIGGVSKSITFLVNNRVSEARVIEIAEERSAAAIEAVEKVAEARHEELLRRLSTIEGRLAR